MDYKLPIGRFVEDILGFQGLFDIVSSLARRISEERGIEFDEGLEYVVTKDDYNLLKKHLAKFLREEVMDDCHFEGDEVLFSNWVRVPRSSTIEALLETELADRIRRHLDNVLSLRKEGLEAFPASKFSGVVQDVNSKAFYRYRVGEKRIELIMNMKEQLRVLSFNTVVDWFIREFLKKNLEDECLLKSVTLEKVETSPAVVESAEEVDELLLTFVVEIEVSGDLRRYRVETSNWVEKRIQEV